MKNKKKARRSGANKQNAKHQQQQDLSADEWAQAQKVLDQQLKELGLYCKEISADGNCLSLSDQFYGNTKQHSKIRKEICAYLEENFDHFQFFVEDDKPFDYHIAQMKKDGTYGGNMELVGFAQLYGVDIKIYQPGTIYVIEGNENNKSTEKIGTKKTLHIAYVILAFSRLPKTIYHNWEHYSSVRNIQGPHEGDPEIISESIHSTNDPASDTDNPPNSIEKMIMSSTGEKNLATIRDMMTRLQFNHDEVINELIERSQKKSINGNGSYSKEVEEDVNPQEQEEHLPMEDSSQSKATIQPDISPRKDQETLDVNINAKTRNTRNLIEDDLEIQEAEDNKQVQGQKVYLNGVEKMDDLTSGSDSDYTKYWIDWFLSTKGNEYFCEVDEEYILDRFNLTGLNSEVQHYVQALDLITDSLEEELDDEMREAVEKSARHLYGLIHARFIITSRGLAKMLEKYKKADFGRCPRVLCHNQPLLPVGLSDQPYTKSVKLYCPRCEDIYNPKSTRHASIDGAYYGSTFPHMLFQVYPHLLPPKSNERYVPRIFGFKIHDIAKQHRWQDQQREEQQRRITVVGEGNANS
ncbi:15775_t:CDS:10 [Funneliformis geosporum]|uniref:Casein kinase II subunit beta n=1 Tax=Funneliformis geosporum TaxID=1117311 RepID=A0A9W4WSD3_9GLOM|nr:15775_t:CDS:10 [Funneliformis geosporum]